MQHKRRHCCPFASQYLLVLGGRSNSIFPWVTVLSLFTLTPRTHCIRSCGAFCVCGCVVWRCKVLHQSVWRCCISNYSQLTLGAPSLEVFEAGLDEALSSLVLWKMSLPMAGVVGLGIFKGPFQPKLCYDSMTCLKCVAPVHDGSLCEPPISV